MKPLDLLIFGTGKIAQLIGAQIMEDEPCGLSVAGFCVDASHYREEELLGRPVARFEDVQRLFPPEKYQMLVALGYQRLNALRSEKCSAALGLGYRLAGYVHSRACVSKTAEIGRNCVILDQASVGPFARLGHNVFIFPQAAVAHHAELADNVWVTSGAVVGGGSAVGANSFLGLNSTVGHEVKLGAENFLGAGAVVTKCSPDKAVFINPDTPKYRLNTDQFLKMFKFK